MIADRNYPLINRIACHPLCPSRNTVFPSFNSEKSLLYAIDNNDVTLISAETGSGKTTRTQFIILEIPQMLIQGGYTIGNKIIGVVVGRRIAAVGLAQRVAEELGCHNG